MFKEVADIQTADMLNLPVPKANYHNMISGRVRSWTGNRVRVLRLQSGIIPTGNGEHRTFAMLIAVLYNESRKQPEVKKCQTILSLKPLLMPKAPLSRSI